MKGFWHICTEGLAKEIIFKDKNDFIFGMNGIAIYSLMYNATILAFCLMDNHVHFILQGTENTGRSFMKSYKKRLASIADMKTAEVCIKRIDTNDYLKKAICYVLRNPSLADRRILPWNYRWSSAGLYFNSGNMPEKEAQTVASVGVRKLRETFRTRFRLPDDLPVSEDGMICPQYYTDYKAVERLFGTSLSLLYFLSRNDSMEIEMTETVLRKVSYTDNELRESVKSICFQRFGKHSAEELSVENRCRLAMLICKRYGIGVKQAARLTGLNPDLLKAFSR